ncbi:hypothetical protein BLX87_22805 [Bacillus sp. VT-16-64]|nr:hypothetical protein BLX87_22805 [Bacillus sp. VT-16-64]
MERGAPPPRPPGTRARARADVGRPSVRPTGGDLRGAPGYRPEHPRAACAMAAAQGAEGDWPDLVSPRDGVLVVRHDNMLGIAYPTISRCIIPPKPFAIICIGFSPSRDINPRLGCPRFESRGFTLRLRSG